MSRWRPSEDEEEALVDWRRDIDRRRRDRGRGVSRPRRQTLEVQSAKVERQKIVQKVSATGKIQPKTQVEISADVSAKITQARRRRGAVGREGRVPRRAGPRALPRRGRERRGERQLRGGERGAGAREHERRPRRSSSARRSCSAQRARVAVGLRREAGRVPGRGGALQVRAWIRSSRRRAALKQARDDLSKTTIYAPMAGTVSELNKEQGEIALGSQFQTDVILVVADLSRDGGAGQRRRERHRLDRASARRPRSRWTRCPTSMLNGEVSEICEQRQRVAARARPSRRPSSRSRSRITDPPQDAASRHDGHARTSSPRPTTAR